MKQQVASIEEHVAELASKRNHAQELEDIRGAINEAKTTMDAQFSAKAMSLVRDRLQVFRWLCISWLAVGGQYGHGNGSATRRT